jgi:hypothetical protein
MRYLGLLFGFFALTLFVLPGLTAQEKGKDKKADVEAKDDNPEPEKKDKKKGTTKEKKEKKPVEEIPPHGPVVKTKIVSMKADSVRDFTVEVSMPDPMKMYNLQMWQQQQMVSIAQSPNPQTYNQRLYQFQMQLAQKQNNGEGFSMKPVDVQATEKCKVRIMYPPLQYDDAGNLKKWSKKEIAALKGTSKLPGFPADFDLLKNGQYVEIYLAKQHGSPKGKWTGKNPNKKKMEKEKAPVEDDDPIETRPQVILIVIWAEPKGS